MSPIFFSTESKINEILKKIDDISTLINESNLTLDNINSITSQIKINLSEIYSILENIDIKSAILAKNTTLSSIINKLQSINTKLDNITQNSSVKNSSIFINNVSIISPSTAITMEHETNIDDIDINFLGSFVPKVSGLHKITLNSSIVGSYSNFIISVGTMQDIIQSVIIMSLCESGNLPYSSATKIGRLFDLFLQNKYYIDNGVQFLSPSGVTLAKDYLGSYNITSSITSFNIYCEANNPMFLLGVNKSTSQDITINTLNMTVEILEN